MLKVFKYLKSSIFSVLAVILLLFVQAYLDLTLPDYTSKIINVGVQQAGIENAAILALQMLGIEDEKIADQLSAMKKDMVEKVIEKVRRTSESNKGGYTSIMMDIRNGRKTEVDTISGAVVAKAHELGVPVPHHEMAVSLIHALEGVKRI